MTAVGRMHQYTAPTDAALASDIIAAKSFGFNAIRLHQKQNPDRWYYHADRLGIVVLQDAVQKYGGPQIDTVNTFLADLKATVDAVSVHPAVVQVRALHARHLVSTPGNPPPPNSRAVRASRSSCRCTLSPLLGVLRP